MTIEYSKVGDGAGNTVYSIFVCANQDEIDGTNTKGPKLSDMNLKDVYGGFILNTSSWEVGTLLVDGPSKTWNWKGR